MIERKYYVYMMASVSGTLYIGVTNDLKRRAREHKSDLVMGFSKKYFCHKLVYFEEFNDVNLALEREKQLKNWRREKKEYLIGQINPRWEELDIWS